MKDLAKRVSNLLTIKSIVTLALVGTFCYMVCGKFSIPTELTDVVMIVIGFYFGTQAKKE